MHLSSDILIRRLYDSTVLHDVVCIKSACTSSLQSVAYMREYRVFMGSIRYDISLVHCLVRLNYTQYWVGMHLIQVSSTKYANSKSANAKKRQKHMQQSDKVHHICILTRNIKCIFEQD